MTIQKLAAAAAATAAGLAMLAVPATLSASTTATFLAQYVGYTIVYSGMVTGFVERDGKRATNYEGCAFGRKIILNHTLTVACKGYSNDNAYSYYPPAVLLASEESRLLVVGNQVIEVQ
ncbi:MAG: hypothetical protein HUK26_04805 [Duodenibacillus sp.]|nr:hypothetical protein [Duodenibacillus sp.]